MSKLMANRPIHRLRYYGVDLDAGEKVQTQYQLAIRQYLQRNFARSWEIMQPTMDKILSDDSSGYADIKTDLKVKCYKLYMSLYDLILKQLESNDTTIKFPQFAVGAEKYSEAKQLQARFMKGILVDNAARIYDFQLSDADPELVLMCFIIEKGDQFPLPKLQAQAKSYLSQTGVLVGDGLAIQDPRMQKVLDFYLDLLVEQGEADQARQTVLKVFVLDDSKAQQFLAKVNDAEEKREHQVQEKPTQQSYSSSTDTLTEDSETVGKSEDFEDALSDQETPTSVPDTQTEPTKKLVHRPNGSMFNMDQASLKKTMGSFMEKHLPKLNSLLAKYNTPISRLISAAGLLVFLLSFILSLKGFRRGQARDRLLWLLQRLRNTLSMAFKVTYI